MIETIIIVLLVVGTYLSALAMALRTLSRASLRARLSDESRIEAAEALLERLEAAMLFSALLRTAFRLGVFVAIMIEVLGIGADATLEPAMLAMAFGIALLTLWLCTTVISSAIARHAGTGVVVRSLWLLRIFALLGTPLWKLVGFLDEAVRRLAAAEPNEAKEAEAELLRNIEETHLEGGLDEQDAELLENVVEFRTTDVGEVMTPRTDIEGVEVAQDLAAIRDFIIEAGHSRIPVYRENLDNIAGILYVKDLVPYLGADASDFDLESLLRQPILVPETKPVRELLKDFQQSVVHMAIVIDEYGGTAGLVTIEDVLEEIVGEIHDEHEPDDDEEPELVALDDTHAEVDGRFHIDDLNERLALDLPEDEEYDTVGGFVLASLGRVPEVGDSFQAHNATFTAIVATPTHVKRIGIELFAPMKANGERRNGNGHGKS